ncbi:hypothetical protein TVAG_206200 [Trichomonas vaginalis G3]|uniref:Ankyrin repeat protein n=1 Tax=Trichomonas vaginalis (strain ATCC PRA-98 / G3) TaxID=412133 RepID=A2E1K5_TRIV3|nr:hypothetical protein TVAGG3_0519280 [Trichomonas vaginalis G3]EAY13452.1 hypothetical protein TVAG_206200 [Trichomonas vaginalis G3]KAI5518353.1 hypothetical protein TVAGG3_0519280 [Trichomonas vaginalis G3]|eukprot:XP_001325675.1 hypothetical protein [Trichomonas vaginalis G3]
MVYSFSLPILLFTWYKDGKTALHYSADKNGNEIVDVLIYIVQVSVKKISIELRFILRPHGQKKNKQTNSFFHIVQKWENKHKFH